MNIQDDQQKGGDPCTTQLSTPMPAHGAENSNAAGMPRPPFERQAYEIKLKSSKDDAQKWHEQFEASQERLLSALAAIVKHNKECHTWATGIKDVDLSALREHDAEVRKPLVEALEAIPPILDTIPVRTGAHNIRKHISDALVKAKP